MTEFMRTQLLRLALGLASLLIAFLLLDASSGVLQRSGRLAPSLLLLFCAATFAFAGVVALFDAMRAWANQALHTLVKPPVRIRTMMARQQFYQN